MSLAECLVNLEGKKSRCRQCKEEFYLQAEHKFGRCCNKDCQDSYLARRRTNKKLRNAARPRLALVKPQTKRQRLYATAATLRNNPPKSEVWFQSRWERLGMRHPDDRYNEVFEFYIPDCVNHVFKYAIEVDGSIHKVAFVKKRDQAKDRFYKKRGYKVFRLTAYSELQLSNLCAEINQIRKVG